MRTTAIWAVAAGLALVSAAPSAPRVPATEAGPPQLVVELRDGSRLRGTTDLASLPLTTESGQRDLPVRLIRTIAFVERSAQGQTRQEATVRLADGHRVQGSLGLKRIDLQTPYGKLSLPAGKMVRLGVIPVCPADGLVAFWTADGDAEDSVGDHHGTPHGVVYAADRHGNARGAFCFNGKGGFVTIPDGDVLDTDHAFTLSAWVNPTAYQDENGFSGWIASKYYTGGPDGHADYALSINYQGNVEFVVAQDIGKGFEVLAPRPIVPRNAWTHVAATFDRGVMKVYLNGRLVGAKVSQAVQRTDPAEYVHDDVIIGAHWNDTFNFTGAIDDVGIWNRALSEAEIARIAADGGRPPHGGVPEPTATPNRGLLGGAPCLRGDLH